MDSTIEPVAIITGGLRGLGLGIAAQLARDGFGIAVIDLPPASAETEAALAPLAESGARVRYYALDIADLASHGPVLARIQRDFGPLNPLTCLVNNAGIAARPLTDLLELSPQAFDRSIDVNLRGTFFLTQAFANLLLEQEAGEHYRSIIVITSIAAEMASPDRAQYCVSKAGLSATTRLFAARLAGEGIAVHEVRPGFMRTDMTASAGSEAIDQWIAQGRVPMPRWGTSSDVGRAVSTLAQGLMPYTTGQPFWVAGGLNIMRAT